MNSQFKYIDENYKSILFDVEEAKAKYRNVNEKIDIMAVTKTVDPEAINYAIGCGVNHLGENRVQEYLSKKDFYNSSADVQFIGHLQTNKVKYIIDSVSVIQSVDNLKLAQEIDRQASKLNIKKEILIELNIGNEVSKSGTTIEELETLLFQISEFKNISVQGLMTIPPIGSSENYFYKMNELFIDIRSKNIDNIYMRTLSMGMSADYQLAVKHGSNLIRIGTKLFGIRK